MSDPTPAMLGAPRWWSPMCLAEIEFGAQCRQKGDMATRLNLLTETHTSTMPCHVSSRPMPLPCLAGGFPPESPLADGGGGRPHSGHSCRCCCSWCMYVRYCLCFCVQGSSGVQKGGRLAMAKALTWVGTLVCSASISLPVTPCLCETPHWLTPPPSAKVKGLSGLPWSTHNLF